jgi:hypothetical protein
MDRDLVEVIGRAADSLDNMVAATDLPLSPIMHLACLKGTIKSLSEELKCHYREETGEDPWEDQVEEDVDEKSRHIKKLKGKYKDQLSTVDEFIESKHSATTSRVRDVPTN